MSLLLLPDDVLVEVLVVLANDDPQDAVALGVTCRHLFAMAARSVARFSVRRVFPVEPFDASQLRAARRRVAATARVLAVAAKVHQVVLILRNTSLRLVNEPLGARQRRQAETELLFQRLIGVVGSVPVPSLVVDSAVVRLVLPGVSVSKPADAMRELVMNNLFAHSALNDGATTLLQLCGRSLRILKMEERPLADDSNLETPLSGYGLYRWFHGAASLPALVTLTVQASFHYLTALRLAAACPALQHFTVGGYVAMNAFEPLKLPAWPSLTSVTVRYSRRLSLRSTGLVEFLRNRTLTGGLRVGRVDWVAGAEPDTGVHAQEVVRAVEAMRETPSPLVVELPLDDHFVPAA